MDVDEAYFESAIPSNLFDDDIDVDDYDEVPAAGISEQQRYHHLETEQESIDESKKHSLICDDRQRDSRGGTGNSDADEDAGTIKALEAAVKIVQSQQEEQLDIDDEQKEEAKMYGIKVKQAVRQEQEDAKKVEQQVRGKFGFLLFQFVVVE